MGSGGYKYKHGELMFIDSGGVHHVFVDPDYKEPSKSPELDEIQQGWDAEDVASVPMKLIFKLLMFVAWRMV